MNISFTLRVTLASLLTQLLMGGGNHASSYNGGNPRNGLAPQDRAVSPFNFLLVTRGSDGIHCLEFKLDFFPQFASYSKFRRPLSRFADNVVTFTSQVATFVTSLNTSF